MQFSNNQKGIIHFGIIGIIVLAAGLFVASKLASNPDLTFFNIAEQAKGLVKVDCEKAAYKKSLVCKQKTKKNELPECKSGLYCTKNKIGGAFNCAIQGVTNYCCPSGQKDLGKGKCEAPSASGCPSPACSKNPIEGASYCKDSDHPNGSFCCPKGEHLIDAIGACSSLIGNPPACSSNVCSTDPNFGGSLCVKASNPDQALYCK